MLTAGPSQSATEGTSTNINLGSFTGGGGSWTATVNWGDGLSSSFATSPGALSAAHTYTDNGTYTAQVTVTDLSGASRTSSLVVTVGNAAPTVTITSPAAGTYVATRATLSLAASFSDLGVRDTHTCSVTWGDGSSSAGAVTESNGSGSCASSHAYTTNGTYTITVKVTDNAGAFQTQTVSVTVSTSGVRPGFAPAAFTGTAAPTARPATKKKTVVKPTVKRAHVAPHPASAHRLVTKSLMQ